MYPLPLQSAQNNNIPPPAASSKSKGQISNSGVSSKVFENSNEEQKLAIESYCDLNSGKKSEAKFVTSFIWLIV